MILGEASGNIIEAAAATNTSNCLKNEISGQMNSFDWYETRLVPQSPDLIRTRYGAKLLKILSEKAALNLITKIETYIEMVTR